MTEIRAIQLPNGRYVYVEIEIAELPAVKPRGREGEVLPEGAEPTGIGTTMVNSIEALRDSIGGVVHVVQEAFAAVEPDEWAVELNIGFKGKVTPIPVLLGGEAQAAIKLTAKWKRVHEP